MKKIARFFVSVKGEMKKVKWPTRKEMVKYAGATFIFVLIFMAFFLLLDLLLAQAKNIPSLLERLFN